MQVEIKSFEQLSLDELYEILQLRSAVFVVEQNCLYEDIDGRDKKAYHVLGLVEKELVAYTRIFPPKEHFHNAIIGRVAVKSTFRKAGYGKMIMIASLKHIKSVWQGSGIELSAQTYLKRFYQELGFSEVGEEYLEDGIPHIKMSYYFRV